MSGAATSATLISPSTRSPASSCPDRSRRRSRRRALSALSSAPATSRWARCGGGGLAHSFSSRLVASLRVDGRELPEAALNAAIAAQFGVPTTLVSGDDACIAEVEALLGPLEGVVTKRSLGFSAAAGLPPAVVEDRLCKAATRAVARVGQAQPWRLEGPLAVDIVFKSPLMAEVLSYLPLFERTGATDIRFQAADAGQIARYLQFFIQTLPALA